MLAHDEHTPASEHRGHLTFHEQGRPLRELPKYQNRRGSGNHFASQRSELDLPTRSRTVFVL